MRCTMIWVLLFSDSQEAIVGYHHNGTKIPDRKTACERAKMDFGVQNVTDVIQLDESDGVTPIMEEHLARANMGHDFRVLLAATIREVRKQQ